MAAGLIGQAAEGGRTPYTHPPIKAGYSSSSSINLRAVRNMRTPPCMVAGLTGQAAEGRRTPYTHPHKGRDSSFGRSAGRHGGDEKRRPRARHGHAVSVKN